MAFPWVSRERYDEKVAELKASELARKELLDRLLGVVPVSAEAVVDDLARRATENPEELNPVPESPDSPAGLRKMAQTDAFRRAGRLR